MPAQQVLVGPFSVEVVNTFIHVPDEDFDSTYIARPRAASCPPGSAARREGGESVVEMFAADRDPEELTTVMIRGVPRRMLAEKLFANLSAAGFEGEYDYVYLPGNRRTRVNKGYVFLNMCSVEAAERLRRTLHGKKWGDSKLHLLTARCQGIYENLMYLLEELQELRETRGDVGPVLFVHTLSGSGVLQETAVADAARQWAKRYFLSQW